jgi:isopenicillin N synthase-like dioxygenase
MIDIPVIDISPFLDGSSPDTVAAAVDAACRDSGFFVITGHGVEQSVIDETRNTALEFFRLPTEEKMLLADHPYSPFQAERLSYSRGEATPPDLKEGFSVSQPDPERDPFKNLPQAAAFARRNIFPSAPDHFEAISIRYYALVEALSAQLQEIFAIALGLPREHFERNSDHHFSSLRYVYYPAPKELAVPGQLRAGAHTDYGDFTLVNIEERAGGLEVLAPDGSWITVPVIPDGFVVNIGDLMEVWTNERWVSTTHRVVVPEEERFSESERLSLVFFHEPNWDTDVTALPTCVDELHPAKFEKVSAGEHLQMKVTRQRTLSNAS